MDEETCFQHLRQGGLQAEAAVTVLYQRYRRPFATYLMRSFRFPQSLAEDVTQDAFVNLVRHLHNHGVVPSGAEGGRPWLWTILRNAARDKLRQADYRHLALETTPDKADPMLPIDQASRVQRAWRAFAADHPERAEALGRAVVEGWSMAELAESLHKSAGATREYVSQCRKEWRTYGDRLCRSEAFHPEPTTNR